MLKFIDLNTLKFLKKNNCTCVIKMIYTFIADKNQKYWVFLKSMSNSSTSHFFFFKEWNRVIPLMLCVQSHVFHIWFLNLKNFQFYSFFTYILHSCVSLWWTARFSAPSVTAPARSRRCLMTATASSTGSWAWTPQRASRTPTQPS